MGSTSSLYAAIDLGSNSFHMLVVRELSGSIQTLTRIKRIVRLAAGLNSENALSIEAMERGWQCLLLFSERLQDIPPSQIRVDVCKISLPRKFALSLRRHYDLPSMRVILLPKRRKSSVVRYR